MKTISHKGYIARIEFDDDDHIFTGRLIDIESIVTFHGKSAGELEAAFHDAVDHYLEVCEKVGTMRPQYDFSKGERGRHFKRL